MRRGLVALVLVAACVMAIMWMRSTRQASERPRLFERYAESWGWGKSGESIPLLEGLRLPTTVGMRQRFTPAVCAPSGTTLSNVVLSVCLPFDLPAGLVAGWRLNAADGCAQYAVRFLAPINRGTCGNPSDALFFTPTAAGRHQIRYSVSSAELPEVTGSFVVEAK